MENFEMSKMAMSFHFSKTETILFSCWSFDGIFGLIGSCIACIFICFIFETIKWIRIYLEKLEEKDEENESSNVDKKFNNKNFYLFYDFVLNIFQQLILYSLMLIVMTMNLWLLFSIVFGESVSHLFFRIYRRKDYKKVEESENC